MTYSSSDINGRREAEIRESQLHESERRNMRDSSDNQSSEEIRADIDQTRAAVGSKIDQLQARLDPNRLKEQAQETVSEMISDTANSMTEYVRTHRDEMVSSVTDAARRNPIPTALVGLGLGWLLLESLGGNKRDESWEYERRMLRNRARSRFEGSTGRSFVNQGRGQYMEEDYYSPEYYDESSYGRAGYLSQGETSGTYDGDRESGRQAYGNGHRHDENPLAKAAGAVKDKASEIGETIKDKVEDAGEEVKDRMNDMRHEAMDRMDEMRHGAQQRMGNRMEDARWRAQRSMNRAEGRMDSWREQADEQMHEWRDRARYEGRRRGRQLSRNLEDNPLTYGAVALAAGMALALLLPQTRTENRAFGETRDRLMDRGEEVFENVKERAQEVVEEVRPELENKMRDVAEDLKETGKQAAKDAAEEMRPVLDKAMDKGKEEARGVAKDAGVDPDKLTGNKLVLNRDTLQGKWKEVKGQVKRQWGKITDDEMMQIEGDYDKLLGAIQKQYGYGRERAEREVNDFFKQWKPESDMTGSMASSKA